METLKEFLGLYQKWLDDGAIEGEPFSRCAGLCVNLVVYANDDREYNDEYSEYYRLKKELDNLLHAQFGKYMFSPFTRTYFVETAERTCHLNPMRNAFVRDNL